MKKIICSQCGAKINLDKMICEYCGSVFEKPETAATSKTDKISKKTPPKISDESLIEILNSTCKENKFIKNLFPILFMIFWTSVCGFIFAFTNNIGNNAGFNDEFFETGNSLNSIFNFFNLIPLCFLIFGIVMTVSIIRKSIPININEAVSLIKKKEYEKAFGWLRKKNEDTEKNNYLFGMIILCYYKLYDEDMLKLLFAKLSVKDLAWAALKNNVINMIANDLGLNTIQVNMSKN